MNPLLSIIMASHNDTDQTALTVASIRENTPADAPVEIVVVDDCSATALRHYVKTEDGITLVVNSKRCGCGPSRHIGALHAKGSRLLIIDSHMRFTPGWFDEWQKAQSIAPNPDRTVFCATCLGLDSKHMDVNAPAAVYHGATMNFLGPDRYKPGGGQQVFEAVWLPKDQEPEDGQYIPAVMGAAYFMSRQWFLVLEPCRFLRTWGCDEQMISLKTWLAGGSVRMAKNVRIGHKFLIDGKEVQKWATPVGHVLWNKLFAINTLLPEPLANTLTAALLNGNRGPDAEAAKRMYVDNYYLVAQERANNSRLFKVSVQDYAAKFGIPLP